MHDLVRQAILATSSHNTQCWRFQIVGSSISITPDMARRCPVVDPDDHHVFVSLGCALENMVQATLANALRTDPRFDPGGDGVIVVSLEPTQKRDSPMSQAISERQCTCGDDNGQPISPAELLLLEKAGTGKDVSVQLLTARPAMESVLEYVVAANTMQMNDGAFVAELKTSIRFSAGEALRTGDGLFAEATGNPALPRWLGSPLMALFYTPKSESERYTRQIRNSAGIAVFVSERSDASGRGGPVLRAIRPTGHGAGHPQCVPEPARRGRRHPASVRLLARTRVGDLQARPGGAIRAWRSDAAVDAAAGAGGHCLKARSCPRCATR